MGEKYIFTIEHLTKTYGKKEVLKDIYLYFYPGAKIGVIGSNGAGKSTLLEIMAGEDKDFMGEAWPDDRGHHRLRPAGAAADARQDGPGERRGGGRPHPRPAQAAGGDRRGDGRPPTPTSSTSSPTRWTGCRPRSTRPTPTTSTARSRSPWTRCGCRRRTPRSSSSPAASGGASPCARRSSSSHDLLLLDEPTNHLDAERVEWLEHHLAGVPRRGGRRHARPLLPRQRRPVDPGTGPRPRLPVQGQLLGLAGAEAGSGWRWRRSRSRPGRSSSTASWSGRRWPRGRGWPRARPASRPSTSCRRR